MKRFFIICLLLCFPVVLFAAPPEGGVALGNGYRAPLVNPALSAWGGASGFALELSGYSDGDFDDGALYFNGRHLGYIPSWEGSSWSHAFYLAFPFFRNAYMGALLETDFGSSAPSWTGGLLLRPSDGFGFGLRGDIPSSGSSSATAGVAFRPLALIGGSASFLGLGFDLTVDDSGISDPLFSLRSEPIEGLELHASYDLESETVRLGASLALYSTQVGGTMRNTDDDPLSAGKESSLFVRIASDALSRPRLTDNDTIVRYRFGGPVREVPSVVRFGRRLLGDDSITLREHIRSLNELADDPLVDGIIFVNEHPASSLSVARELLVPLKHFREKGKKVMFYFDTADTDDYLLAAACGAEIYLHPEGSVDLKGVSVTRSYFATFLDTYGIKFENFRSHPYKSGFDTFTEGGMREPEREELTVLVADMERAVAQLLQEGRGDRLAGDAGKILAGGPYLRASRALDAGLIDKLLYRDEIEDAMDVVETYELPAKSVRRDWNDPRPLTIAIINLTGNIHSGEGVPGESVGADTTVRSITLAREDDSIDAIVLRINSGGGGLLASDSIARAVSRTVSGENAKPVVVSMGSMAASGAYYIAARANVVFAYPETMTGSIGVVAITPDISRLLEEHKIAVETVKQSPEADFGSPYRPLLAEEREKIKAMIASGYDHFVENVADGRDMKRENVERIAQGRVWSGSAAQEKGLVDEIGGMDAAVKRAAELSGRQGAIELADYTIPERILRLPFLPPSLVTAYHGLGSVWLPLSSSFDRELELLREGSQRGEYLYSLTPYRPE
ncbi:signal peptide peptidase SppA [Sediminispirochaeta smaragdinae]|uniref:Signal peptide peptidase SppA, 36K type n=1 Tax=Sediminispirochaeta smaragdinae (strain DSM 11293 / JCM 15392 / SEBR 4228) TaxID=573413 RepID=E1R9C6_SEDSS|nr:signal peptide peptidase SppA [Sediminispirochaeta smaragdinae]ADK83095.1 signal peptide peptidase SppA, 36K type [Sediminispirochaeta smaragdinae DSM 11293]